MGTYLTKGTTFTTGDTVTAANLNNLVDNATVTAGSIGSTELGADSVTNGKIIDSATGSEPVTTGTIRDNAIDNTKLAGMTRGTVKVGDSSGAASDLDAKTNNAFLAGDGTDIKSKTFDSGTAGDITITSTASNFYLEIASNSIANAMVKNDAINPAKISHSSDSNPGVIVYGASGTPAELTTTASNSVLTSNGASAPSWEGGLVAKAFLELTTLIDGNGTGTGKTSIASTYNFGTELTSGTLTSTIRYYIVEYKAGDDFTGVGAASNATGVEFDATGTAPTWTNGSRLVASPVFSTKGELVLVFSSALANNRFFAMSTANWSDNSTPTASDWEMAVNFKVSSKATSGFTINFRKYNSTEVVTPLNIQILVF